MVLLGILEVYARYVYKEGIKNSSFYTVDKELRFVTEAYHHTLWNEPWANYKPNSYIEHSKNQKLYSCSINRLGFRGSEALNESINGKNASLIACIGGSTTVEGENDQKTYPATLEKYLQADGFSISVLNAGIAGLDSTGYKKLLNSIKRKHKPNFIIEYNAVNDVCWRLIPHWIKQMTRSDGARLKVAALQSVFLKLYFSELLMPDRQIIRKDLKDFVFSNLLTVAKDCEENNSTLFVCSFAYPTIEEGDARAYSYFNYNLLHWWNSLYFNFDQYVKIVDIYNEDLKTFANDNNIHYIPVNEIAFFETRDFLDICHMKQSGIEKKAKVISDYISNHL